MLVVSAEEATGAVAAVDPLDAQRHPRRLAVDRHGHLIRAGRHEPRRAAAAAAEAEPTASAHRGLQRAEDALHRARIGCAGGALAALTLRPRAALRRALPRPLDEARV